MKLRNIFDILKWPVFLSFITFSFAVLISTLFFSQLPILETVFLPQIVVGTIFLFAFFLILSIIVYNVKEYACFDVIPLPIIQIDKTGKIVYINRCLKESLKQYKIPKTDNVLEYKDFIVETDKFETLFKNILKNPKAYLKHYENFTSINGLYFKLNIVNIGEKGNITIIGLNETYSRDLETKIEKQDKFYKNLINNIPFPIEYRDVSGHPIFENDFLKNIYDKLSKNMKDGEFKKYDLKYRQKIKNKTLEVLKTNKPQVFNLFPFQKWAFEIQQTPYTEDGQTKGVICVGVDKTNDYIYKKQTIERIKYQNLLYKLQKVFLNSNVDNYKKQIQKILKHINDYMSGDVVYFYEFDDKFNRKDFYEYKKSYSPSYIEKIRHINPQNYTQFMEKFESHGEFIINDTFNDKSESGKFFYSLGVVSVFEICLYGKNFKGMIGIATFTKQKVWKKLEISLLKILSETLLNTIERLIVEKQLRESEETFNILSENSPLGIVIFDISTRYDNIHYINQEAIDSLGYTEYELNNMKIEEIIDNDFIESYYQLLENKNSDDNRAILKFNRKNDSITVEMSLRHIKINESNFSDHILVSIINLNKAEHIYRNEL